MHKSLKFLLTLDQFGNGSIKCGCIIIASEFYKKKISKFFFEKANLLCQHI